MSDRLLSKKIENYSVEQLTQLIKTEAYQESKLLDSIDNSGLDNHHKEQLSIKIKRAFHRVNEPLEISLKIFFLICPFGIVNSVTRVYDHDLKRFKEFGYFEKEATAIRYSFIGVAMYLIGGLIVGLYWKSTLS